MAKSIDECIGEGNPYGFASKYTFPLKHFSHMIVGEYNAKSKELGVGKGYFYESFGMGSRKGYKGDPSIRASEVRAIIGV